MMEHRDPAETASDQRAARWLAAAIAIFYGFAKLNGSQFTILLSELDKPLGEVNGFWLTWYYFGYSRTYCTLIALTEIGAGLLLTVPRLALMGAFILLPVAANIVIIDLCYGVDRGGLLAAILLFALLLSIVSPHARCVVQAIVPDSAANLESYRSWVPRAALVLSAFVGTYWIANYNNRAPTAIDGAWTPTVVARAGPLTSVDKMFFERNRASLVVVKTRPKSYQWRHFALAPDGTVRVWEKWLRQGPLLYEGRYSSTSGRIRLWPAGSNTTLPVILEMKRD
jgi:hypothetical protein